MRCNPLWVNIPLIVLLLVLAGVGVISLLEGLLLHISEVEARAAAHLGSR